MISFSLVPNLTNLDKYGLGVPIGFLGGTYRFGQKKTGKRLLMGGLGSCWWLLEVISFSLVPNLANLEKYDFGGTYRFWGVWTKKQANGS